MDYAWTENQYHLMMKKQKKDENEEMELEENELI